MNQPQRSTQPWRLVGAFNSVLLALYDVARRASLDEFQDGAVNELSRMIRFDGCWWGIGTSIDGHQHIHHSFVRGLPRDMAAELNRTEARNIVARRCFRRPGTALVFSAKALAGNSDTASLARYAHIAQVLCACTFQETSHLVMFLSLTRELSRPRFSARDARCLELLLPHLEAMLQVSRVLDISRERTRRAGVHSCLAVTDVRGILHVAEPGFDAMIGAEWPGWKGPALPEEVIAAIGVGRSSYSGRVVILDLQAAGSQIVITVRHRAKLDDLSRQERLVAEAFASGRSYKEVARLLGSAPATVRHHLRVVYSKLGVCDKAALARVLI